MTSLRLLPVLFLALSLHAEKPSPEAVPLSPIAASQEPFVKDGQLAGAVTLVWKDNQLLSHEAVGFQELETKTPMQKDSLFWIASMTKPITAFAVMMLQDEGKLSIDDPVSKYLPEFKTSFTEGMGMGLGFHIVVTPTAVTATLSPGTYGHGGAHGTQGWIDPVKKTIHILLIQRAGLKNGDASPMRQAFHEATAKMMP